MAADADPALLAPVADGLAHRVGFRYNPGQPEALWNALSRRAASLGLPDRQSYVAKLRTDEVEWSRLAEEMAIHETCFFRHQGQFRAVVEEVLPNLVALRGEEKRLRVWSAGCATGEEPYSLAIALHRLHLGPAWNVKVFATDLSTKALKIAEKAVFDLHRLRSLPPGYLDLYFEAASGKFRLRDEIRSLVEFRQLNLTEGAMPGFLSGLDLVFCENVLIYLHPSATRRVVAHLREALREGSYLFLGYAETLYGLSEGFEPVRAGDTYFYRRVKIGRRPSGVFAAPHKDLPRREAAPREAPVTRSHGHAPGHAAPAPAPVRRGASPPSPPRPRRASSATLKRPKPPSKESISARIAADDYAGAARLAETWLALEPASKEASHLLARLHAASGQPAAAADLVRKLLANDPLHVPSYILLGVLCYRQRELAEAAAEFERALYLEPKSPLAYFYLGNIHQESREAKKAVHAYKNALRFAAHFAPEWDSGFTKELLVATCEKNIERLSRL